MRNRGIGVVIVMLACLSLIFGCATITSTNNSLMPTEKKIAVSNWKNYQSAIEAFNRIEPNKTTMAELKKIGFDPNITPNTVFLDPISVRNIFLGNNSIRIEDLPKDLQEYLKDFDECRGFKFRQEAIFTKGEGNILSRLLKFKKEDLISGWQFEAWVFMKKNKVVYTLWLGNPNIREVRIQKNPLGAFSDILGNIPAIALRAIP